MTLDEAIKHEEEVAEEQDMKAGFDTDYQSYTMSEMERKRCKECAEEHRQLAEWLKELKQLREQTDGDLISRQDALKCFNVRELKFKDKEDAELMKHYLELSFNNLEKLPSVEKTEKWISVSERLPEKNDIYVVWTSKGFGDHLSTSYYSIEDGWSIGVCAWKENVEQYKEESEK